MKLPLHNPDLRLNQIRQELEFQRQRFAHSTQATGALLQRSSSEVQSIISWIRHHPIQAAGIFFAGGLVATQKILSNEKTP